MENKIDIKEILEEKFVDDPLRKEIGINNLEEYLYTDEILSMHPETTYSTVESGRIIGRKDSTIRNYFRTELVDYIAPEKNGKYYRLDYISVFKLHMILLLVEKANKSIADLAFFCGITPLVSVGNENKRGNANKNNAPATYLGSEVYAQIGQLKKISVMQNLKSIVSEENDKLRGLQIELAYLDREIDSLVKGIEILDLKNQNSSIERKYVKVLDYSLKQTMAKNKGGFLKNLFKSAVTEEDVDGVMNEALQKAGNEKNEEMMEERKSLKKRLDQNKEERQKLTEKINQQKEKVLESKNKVEKIEKNLETMDATKLKQISATVEE